MKRLKAVEVKTVLYKDFVEELNKLNAEFREWGIQFTDMGYNIVDRKSPVQLGVNWSAIGTVDSEKAIDYANAIRSAAEKASNFLYNGYVIEYRW